MREPAARETERAGTEVRTDGDLAMALLLEAGTVLASSLDPSTTMGQVAELTVPQLADLCVIDLLDQDDGSICDVAVAAAEPGLAESLERLRVEHPLDPAGEHPVARVIRSGQPMLLERMSKALLASFAQSSKHARFMISHGYRSAIVAPLLARGRTLGALSALRLGESPPYTAGDLGLACELASRAALAIDNARLYSDLRRTEQRLQAVLVNLAEAITVVDADGNTVFANQAAADLLQVDSPEEVMRATPGEMMARFFVFDEHGKELDLEQMPGRRLFAGEEVQPLLVRNVVRATGEERWLIVRASPVLDPDSGEMLYAVNVLENITDVKRVQLAESFMSEASRVLASSLDYGETLRQVARLAVPTIASWCAVDVLGERGEIERVAIHHPDPEMVALAQRLRSDYSLSLDEAGGVPEVIRTGEPRIYTDIGADTLKRYARDDEHLRLLARIGATAVVIVPMIGADRITGAITLVSSGHDRRLSAEDLPLARRLARRAGTAVETARLYTERSRIAHTLQQALLPAELPAPPGALVSARYRAAGELGDVGGDFYDLFDAGDGAWMLVIGDVCGKGPRAAGVTALARHTLRAGALSSLSPTQMLQMLHRALQAQPTEADLCTVCLVRFERAGDLGRLQVTLAGHPPPLLIDSDGNSRPLGRPGTLLGVLDPIAVHEVAEQLTADQTLLLYTDGVPEARRGDDLLGEEGLALLAARAPALSLDGLLDHIERGALAHAGGSLRDDLALLALRLCKEGE
jgi:PAS domain S-box-containing protein